MYHFDVKNKLKRVTDVVISKKLFRDIQWIFGIVLIWAIVWDERYLSVLNITVVSDVPILRLVLALVVIFGYPIIFMIWDVEK